MLKFFLINKIMKLATKNILYSVMFLFLLTSCQSVKDGLTGNKRNNSDEFLVKKKNPLTLPPKFDKLPQPGNINNIDNEQDEYDFKKMMSKKSSTNKTPELDKSKNSSLKKSILEKIKNN
tara:strand:- start:4464 stop:4823 length:360 start_codon:yes stop_codon:yes gene_type:complete